MTWPSLGNLNYRATMTLCQNAVQVRLLLFWKLCSTYRASLKTPSALAACYFTQGGWNPGSETICLCRWTLPWLQLPPLGWTLPGRVVRLSVVLQHQFPTHIKCSGSYKPKPQILLPLKSSYCCQRWRTGVMRSCYLLKSFPVQDHKKPWGAPSSNLT